MATGYKNRETNELAAEQTNNWPASGVEWQARALEMGSPNRTRRARAPTPRAYGVEILMATFRERRSLKGKAAHKL